MVFSMCIDDTAFNLKLSSDVKPAPGQKPYCTVEYLTPQDGIAFNGDHPDTLIHLSNFSGTLKIVRNVSNSNMATHISGEVNVNKNRKEESVKIKTQFQDEKEEESDERRVNRDQREECKHKEFLDAYEDEEICERDTGFASNSYVENNFLTSSILSSGTVKIENRLHLLCKSSMMNLQTLKDLLTAQPSLASQQDNYGRLPLHILANNKILFNGRQRKDFLSFVMYLLEKSPTSVQIVDDKERIPFTAAIHDWIELSNTRSKHPTARETFLESISNLWTRDIAIPSTLVELPQIVKWSFEMLSHIIEYLERNSYQKPYSTAVEVQNTVLDNVSGIISLLKTVLLIDDNSLKYQILEMPIFQRILLRKNTVDYWLIGMLANGGVEASRAVDYFEAISSLTISGALGSRKVRLSDRRLFHKLREDMINHLASSPGIIPSLFFLINQEKRRASSKYFVQRILHTKIANSRMIGLVMLDLCFNTFLLIAYPFHIQCSAQGDIKASSMVMIFIICIYFLIRDNLATVIMAQSKTHLFKTYSLFTELVKNIAIIFTLWTIVNEYKNAYWGYPVTVGLLWMRFFISYIENPNLATFILSVGEIIKGMKSFLVFLFLGCFMFSEMVKMDYDTNRDTLCAGVDPDTQTSFNADFCSRNHFRAFFRGYTLIAGDMTAEHYRITTFVTFSYVLYTLIGVIVLLNILVAIILDIYQKSFSQRETLLARERLFLLARHAAIETAFKKFITGDENKKYRWRTLFIKIVFIVFFTSFQIGFFLFVVSTIDIDVKSRSPILSIFIIFLYVFVINATLLFFIKELFQLKVLDILFHTEVKTFGCLRIFTRFCEKILKMFLGFKEFQVEKGADDTSVKAIRELLRESETRLLFKLMDNRTPTNLSDPNRLTGINSSTFSFA